MKCKLVNGVKGFVNFHHLPRAQGEVPFTIFSPSPSQVQKMLVVRNSMESSPKLVILTPSSVTAIPLSRCGAVGTCARCVALQDPYCAWDARREVCAALHDVTKMDSLNFFQGRNRLDNKLPFRRLFPVISYLGELRGCCSNSIVEMD